MKNSIFTVSRISTISVHAAWGSFAALAGILSIGSWALGSVTDTPNGFVLRSNGAISLASDVQVSGDVGALGSVAIGSGSTTDLVESGAVHTWTTPVITPWATPSGSNVNLAWAETRSLTAGAYANFTSSSTGRLDLGPGIYTFDTFQLGLKSMVYADTSAGDVYVYVKNSLSAADGTHFLTIGAGKLYLVSLGSMSFGNFSEMHASIYSGGSLIFGTDVNMTGLAYANGSISVNRDSTFTFENVPAPGVGALCLVAGLITGRRRRSD